VARERGATIEVVVDDLAERALPFLDEYAPAALSEGSYAHQHSRDWSGTVACADAVVLVTPQYNAGYPAALKNAIDYLWSEWRGKPGVIVSYGTEGSAGGPQAQLAQVAEFVGINLIDPGARIPLSSDAYDAGGRIADPAATLGAYQARVAECVAGLYDAITTRASSQEALS
jgi:NAD(P)H-dependent FMN reductase